MSCRCAALRVGKKKGAEQRRNRGEAGVPCIDQAQPESQRGPGRVTGTAYGAKARSRKASKSTGALASSAQALDRIRSDRRRPGARTME